MDEIKGDSLGLETYQQVFGEPNERPLTGLRQITIDHLFGDIWSRPGLSLRDRRVITLALLAAQGRSEQLQKHILGALRGGFSKEEILEIMIQVAHYAGWAAGTAGQEITLETLDKIGPETDPEKQRLRRLNEEIGEKEKDGDGKYFLMLLADDFVFRRANGDIVNKKDYLESLEKVAENPYEHLEVHVREVVIDRDSAVADVLVIAKRKNMQRPGRFTNVPMFKREDTQWKLVAWINTRHD